MKVDIEWHREVLFHLVPALPVRLERYAIARMEHGRAKYEKAGLVDNGRDLIAEGIEELVDGLNRLVMEIAENSPPEAIRAELVNAAQSIEQALRHLERIKKNGPTPSV